MSKSNSFYTVYRLIFPNGKSYVGATSQFRSRMRSHKFAAFNGGIRPIQKALRKYGWDTITIEILAEDLLQETAYALEVTTIKDIGKENSYNQADGGKVNRGYTTGIAWNKGKNLSNEHRTALVAAKAGKSYSKIAGENSTKYPVIATSIYGTVKVFPNASECARYLGVSINNVYNHIYRNSKYLIK